MRPAFARFAAPILVALLLAPAACSSARSSSSTAARSDRSLITAEQIFQHRFANAYEAVEALHSNWLLNKSADSFTTPSQVRVYVDNTFVGAVESLRSINPNTIQSIRHFDGIAATARWGLDHGAGVILVTTQR
jgi:hypothetical protein